MYLKSISSIHSGCFWAPLSSLHLFCCDIQRMKGRYHAAEAEISRAEAQRERLWLWSIRGDLQEEVFIKSYIQSSRAGHHPSEICCFHLLSKGYTEIFLLTRDDSNTQRGSETSVYWGCTSYISVILVLPLFSHDMNDVFLYA